MRANDVPRGKKKVFGKSLRRRSAVSFAALTPKREVPETWVIKLALFERRYLFIRVKGMFGTVTFMIGLSEGSHDLYKKVTLDKTYNARNYIGVL